MRAISTWVRASRLRACCAKISMISPARSTTGSSVAFSRFLACAGESSSSTAMIDAPSPRAITPTSSAWPAPMKVAALMRRSGRIARPVSA